MVKDGSVSGAKTGLGRSVCRSKPWNTFPRQAPADPATVMAGTLAKQWFCADFKCLKMYWIYGYWWHLWYFTLYSLVHSTVCKFLSSLSLALEGSSQVTPGLAFWVFDVFVLLVNLDDLSPWCPWWSSRLVSAVKDVSTMMQHDATWCNNWILFG